MEKFVVSCPCPEVWEMLNALAAKSGYPGGEDCVSRHWFLIRDNGCVDAGDRRFVYDNGYGQIISIEAAIAELTKPRPAPLMVGSHKVTIHPDRSVTVGFTTVPAEVCDEIEKRRGAKSSPVYWTFRHALHRVSAMEMFDGTSWVPFGDIHAISHCSLTEDMARQRFPEAFKE